MPRDVDIELERLGALELLHFRRHTTLTGNYVPGEGAVYGAKAFIFGEAPGAQEALARRPFVGPCQVLRYLMDIAGLFAAPSNGGPTHEPNVWLTNTVKFRPPGNRTPTQQEISTARHFLLAEWITVGSPRIVVPVGRVAFEALMNRPASILQHAGMLISCTSKTDRRPLAIWPMLHPSFALRNPGVQPMVEDHWEEFGKWLAAKGKLLADN